RVSSHRCTARVTYTPKITSGQWPANSLYLMSQSALHADSDRASAFGSTDTEPDVTAILGEWQRAGNPRLFKIIISPEFGDRLNLEALTRGLMLDMERDLGTPLEWVATIHRNTEYPHVHVALRGLAQDGQPLTLPRAYVQRGIRANAERLATNQLGYRTVFDQEKAQRREVNQKR